MFFLVAKIRPLLMDADRFQDLHHAGVLALVGHLESTSGLAYWHIALLQVSRNGTLGLSS